MTDMEQQCTLTGQEKLEEVSRLMTLLEKDFVERKLRPSDRNVILEQVKIYGRNVENADPIYCTKGIETLCKYGFDDHSLTTSHGALRCLANAFLLDPKTRQVFVDLGYGVKAAQRLKNYNRDDEFLISRILFLMTYNTDLDFDSLIDRQRLAESLNNNISRHAKNWPQKDSKAFVQPMDDMALSETLKLVFNITKHSPHHAGAFSTSISIIFKLLGTIQIQESSPLEGSVNFLINALLNLNFDDQSCFIDGSSPAFPKFDQNCNVDRLIEILEKSISKYEESELDRRVVPTVTLLRKMFEDAPEGTQKHMQDRLLPNEADRDLPLGKSATLASKLLNLLTSALAPDLREAVSALLFDLSDKDVDKYVQNIGFGYASGFLMNHNIPIPASISQAYGHFAEGSESSSEFKIIDPITGQRLDKELEVELSNMTDAEKEIEAERLFVLFDRLKATGVIDIENPVRQAVEEGRFEELGSDAEEDVD